MSNPCLLHLPLRSGLDGRDRNGVVTATASGPVRFTADGYFAEESTTNLVGNPAFAVNATGWTGATRDTGYAYLGPASGLITATGANAEATYSLTVPASQHTLSAVVKNSAAASRSFQLRYNGANVGSPVVVAAGAETRLSGQITGTAGAAAAGVRITDSANGETFSIGHLQIEAKAYATSPCPAVDASGTISSGYSWAGTAHASASTRSAAYLSLATSDRVRFPQGAMAIRFVPQVALPSGNRGILTAGHYGASNADYLGIHLMSWGSSRAYSRKGTGADAISSIPGPIVIGDRYDLVANFDSNITAWGNGVAGNTSTRELPGFGVFHNNIIYVGSVNGSSHLSGYLSDVLIFDRPLTDAERATLAATPEWSFGVLADRIIPGLLLPV